MSRNRTWRAALVNSTALIAIATASLHFASPAQAQVWEGNTSTDWFTGSNWNGGAVPPGFSDVILDTITPNPTVVNTPGAAADDLFVGVTGTGALTIENGGEVTSFFGYLGYVDGSEGTVTVTGAGSTWTNSLGLTVGNGGIGALIIENGGAVSSTSASVGTESTVMVTGAGSSLTNSDNLTVGSGMLTIADGGAVSNTVGSVGDLTGSTGTVTVTGQNSTWTNSGNLFVGVFGTGTLAIADGGAVSNTQGFVGDETGSRGTVTVTGQNSTWTNSADLFVGAFGTGTLTIENGGTVTNEEGSVGYGGVGAVTVAGAGSTWTNSADLFVGRFDTGTLTIENGGTVSNPFGQIAIGAGSTGAVTVTGPGSNWINSGALVVGREGKGTLTIENGGTVSNTIGVVGYLTGSQSTVTVSGQNSTWNNSEDLAVGEAGTGTLTIADGGAVSNVDGVVGADAGSEGTVTVSGANSAWANSGDLFVGSEGTGKLSIADGGAVTNTGSFVGSIGGSTGAVTVTGQSSTWTNNGFLTVGFAGTGTLTIEEGGAVSNGGGSVGSFGGSEGTVTVTGAGSAWTNFDVLTVGSGGTGTLTIAEGGTVSSTGGFVGRFDGSEGTVTVSGAGSAWTNGDLLRIGNEGTGTLTIANSGTVSASKFLVADQAGSTGTLNIGAAASDPAAAPAVLDATTVEFGAGAGTLNFNHTATDYVFAPAINGTGAVNALAGTTILAADSGGFSGQANVDAATLVVNGALGGTLDVLDGGRLEGAGTVGTTTIASGGTIAPGNSIGTLNVAGDITLDQGSIYEVEVNPAGTDSDLVHATGMATLNGGSVVHIGLPGNYQPLSTYTVLTADSGVTGMFGGVSSNFAFLDPTLTYDPNNVFLELVRNIVSFCGVALTPNQCATGEGAESLGFGNPVYDAVILLDEAGARTAFDLLSGEFHASAKGVLLDDSRFIREAATSRVRATFGDVATPSMPMLAYGPDGSALTPEEQALVRQGKSARVIAPGPAPAPADTERFAAWGQAFGSWGTWDSDGNAASLDRSIGGFLVGADGMIAENWRLGLLAGYSRSSFDVDDRASSGDSDNFHLGLYGGGQWGAFGLRAGAAYTWHDIETARSVSFPGFTDRLTADYDAGTAQAFGELGYKIAAGRFALEPFANLAYVNLKTDAFTEQGGAAALASAKTTTDTTFTTLGLRAATDFTLGEMKATVRGMLGWRHAFGDVTPNSTFAFAGGDAFVIAGVPIAEDALALEAGLDVDFARNATLGLSYSGQIGDGMQDHAFKTSLAVKF